MTPENALAAFEWHRFGLEVGSSAVIGGIIGFAMRKIAKITIFIAGVQLAVLMVLDFYGIIRVNWESINTYIKTLEEIIRNGNPPPEIMNVVTSVAIGGGFVGGFVIGFKRG